jgi:hypothetical protein
MKCAEKLRFCWDTKVEGTKGGKHGSKVAISWHDKNHKGYQRRLLTRSGKYHIQPRPQHRELWDWFMKTFVRPIVKTVKSIGSVFNGSAAANKAFELAHSGVTCKTAFWTYPEKLHYIKLIIKGDNAILIDEAILEKVNFLGALLGGKGKKVSNTVDRLKKGKNSGAIQRFVGKMEDTKGIMRWGKGGEDGESDKKGFCVSTDKYDYEKGHIFGKGWGRKRLYGKWCDKELKFFLESQKVWGNKSQWMNHHQWKPWKHEGHKCVANSDCLGRRCSFKICRRKNSLNDGHKCNDDEDCKSTRCKSGKCLRKFSIGTGQKCEHDHDCRSKSCKKSWHSLSKKCAK